MGTAPMHDCGDGVWRICAYLASVSEAMPFSKHQIDPAHIEAMRAAFNRVCDALLLKCDCDDPMTEIIADKIVALADDGEHDAHRLAELVLNDLADDGLAAADGGEPRASNPRA
jgi:hypothetical protein